MSSSNEWYDQQQEEMDKQLLDFRTKFNDALNIESYKLDFMEQQKLTFEKNQAHVNSLKDEINMIKDKTAKMNSKIAERKEKIAILKQTQSDLAKETENLLSKKEDQEKCINELNRNITILKEENGLNSIHDFQMKGNYEAISKMFNDTLGLKIERIPDGRINVSFSCISQADPDEKFSVCVQVKDDIYIVSDCSHPVKNLEKLIDSLNKTNDFKSFIIRLRKEFQSIS